MSTPDRTLTLHHPPGTLDVVVYGATPRIRGLTPDGETAFVFDITPSFVADARRVIQQALNGEAGTLHLIGWQVTLTAPAPTPDAPRALHLTVPGQPEAWRLLEGPQGERTHTELSSLLRLLG